MPVTASVPSLRTINGTSSLAKSLDFLRQTLKARLDQFAGEQPAFKAPKFEFFPDGTAFSNYVTGNNFTIEEFLVLVLAIAPHAHPDPFGDLLRQYFPKGGEFPEFGGVKGGNYRSIIPTGETAVFLLAGTDLDLRFNILRWLKAGDLTIMTDAVVSIEETRDGEPEMCGRLLLSNEKITEFVTGGKWRPRFGTNFPASLLETEMSWADLVLSPTVHKELQLIQDWIQYQDLLSSDPQLGIRLKPGYRALFHGPPGTGKTLTATLLGKVCDKPVFRVDLSMVVSKYIGETEKNLQGVFDTAANKDWILFFDEADALFGKRTNVQSAHDRFANQEVSYLLQKVEEHQGLVILSTNFKSNVDQAFMRRFQSVVQFTLPNEKERLRLWENTMPTTIEAAPDISLADLAGRYELSGASILNIVHAASIRALSENRPIAADDLADGIRIEYAKSGKSV